MSLVTEVILCMGPLGLVEEKEQLDKVNAFFRVRQVKGFVSIQDESLPSLWYGGGMFCISSIAMGVFNHLELDALITYLKTLDWRWREDVQLIVKEENSRFKIIDMFEVEILRRLFKDVPDIKEIRELSNGNFVAVTDGFLSTERRIELERKYLDALRGGYDASS